MKEPTPFIIQLKNPVIEDRGTHAKVFYNPDWGIRVTFGGLNTAGHYQPLRGDDSFLFLYEPFSDSPDLRSIYDGAGWRINQLRQWIENESGVELE